MLKTRDQTCARRYRFGHPARKFALPPHWLRLVFRREKSLFVGEAVPLIIGCFQAPLNCPRLNHNEFKNNYLKNTDSVLRYAVPVRRCR
jgi:hypothetical protein